MEEFGDSFVSGAGAGEADPAAEFLAREQSTLAGLEDELDTLPRAMHTNTAAQDGFGDFLEEPQQPQYELSNGGGAGGVEEDEAPSVFRQEREEPEKIRIWREEQKKRLEEKDAEEEKRKEELLKVAKKELEDWYKNHNEQIAKTKATNRNAERALARGSEGATEEGGEWARVAELCDFGPRRGRDVARLRSIVLQLKQSGARPKHPPRATPVA